MKLQNKALILLSASLGIIIALWAMFFYFNVLDEIKESVDEGLDNYKRQIIYKVHKDSTLLLQNTFDEGFFSIREIPQEQALTYTDRYADTIMFMQDADDEMPEPEPFRLLSTVFEREGHYYELQIVNSMVEEDDLAEELIYDALWLYFLLIAGIVFINNFVLKRLWTPFYDLLNRLKNYNIESAAPLPTVRTKTKEFVDLQKALHVLLQRNRETYQQQKQFIENAAHELQTPLAIAIGKLELLIEKGNLQNEQAEEIANIMNMIDRLIRLNKSLLLLTKIENRQFTENKIVSFNELLKQTLSEWKEILDYKNIQLNFVENAELTTQMDISLANIIISNLLKNAVQHNFNDGNIDIEISDNRFSISNTSNSPELDGEKIFARFYKSENDRNGTGLGLAIVKAISELYGFTIRYKFQDSKHCFSIYFPPKNN